MRALIYHGSNDVRVDNVDDPQVINDDDILLRVTATAICGSDMHIYRGKFPGMDKGDILGHEFTNAERSCCCLEVMRPSMFGLLAFDRQRATSQTAMALPCGRAFHRGYR
jgi:hypothetical protein